MTTLSSIQKKLTKGELKPGIVCLQSSDPTVWPTQLTPVLGYCYLFKLLPNLTLYNIQLTPLQPTANAGATYS